MAVQILHIGELGFQPELDFVHTNRVVAVIEKAIERLQLLRLLDTTAPPGRGGEDADAHATLGGGGGGGDANQTFSPSQTAKRAAATYDAHTTKLAPAVTGALQEALAEGAAQSRARGRRTVAQLLAAQRELEQAYGRLLRETAYRRPPAAEPTLQAGLAAAPAGSEAKAQELAEVAVRLREVNRQLSTELKDNPNDLDNWNKVNNERDDVVQLLQGVVAELTAGYGDALATAAAARAGTAAGSTMNATNSLRQGAGGASTTAGFNATTNTNGNNFNTSMASNSVAAGGRLDGTTTNFSNTNVDAASSQAPNLKRFGSTVQARRATRNQHAAPRIPLVSSYAHFVQTLLQEKAAQQWADELVKRESELNVNVKQLRSDLLKEQHQREAEVAARQATLGQLQAQLRALQQRLSDREADVRQHAGAAAEGHQRRAQEQDDAIQRQQEAQEAALTAEARAHELFTRHLQQRTAAAEALAAEWDQKNTQDIRKAEQHKLTTEQERQSCADRLAEVLKEREAQLARQAERQALQQEKEAAATTAAARREEVYEAASVLEAAVKAMLTRSALDKGNKKRKPKGKKAK